MMREALTYKMMPKKIIHPFICWLFLIAILPHCGIGAALTAEPPNYQSYRELPGITAAEIASVEKIKTAYSELIFGALTTLETVVDDAGQSYGFTPQLCAFMSKFFGIPVRLQIMEWDDLIAKLDRDEIHFTGELTSSPERLKTYYMTDPIAWRDVIYFQYGAATDIYEILKERPIRAAFLDGVQTIAQVEEVLPDNVETVVVNNYEEAYKKLAAREVDVFFEERVADGIFNFDDQVVSRNFFPLLLNGVSLTTHSPTLSPLITIFQRFLDRGGLSTMSRLYADGGREAVRMAFVANLTPAERAYLSSRKNPIPVGLEFDNYPLSFWNKYEKQWQGICVDLLGALSETTGLKFQPVNAANTSFADLLKMLNNGEVEIVSELIRTPGREDKYLWTDNPYIIDYYVLASSKSLPPITPAEVPLYSLATQSGTAYEETARRWFGHLQPIQFYDDNVALIKAVNDGKVDLAFFSENRTLISSHFMEFTNCVVNVRFSNKGVASYFGIGKNTPELFAIINKALKVIDTGYVAERWTRRVFNYEGQAAKSKLSYVVTGSLVVANLLVVLIGLQWRSRREKKTLREMVVERTTELQLQKERVEQALITAKEASQMKTIFMAKMSHELRTPLNGIIGMTRRLTRCVTLDLVPEIAERINRSAKLLLGVINDILDYNQKLFDTICIENAPFPLPAVVSEVAGIYADFCGVRKINFSLNQPPMLPADTVVFGDQLRLMELLSNLLEYVARVAKGGETVKFSYTIEERAAGGKITVNFRIGGNQTKIDGDAVSQVIGHSPVDYLKNQEVSSSDLSLQTSKWLVQRMGGELNVEVDGDGLTFFAFALKFELVSEEFFAADDEVLLDLANKYCLIVDDNEVNQYVLMDLLEEIGAKVDLAADGLEALKKVTESATTYDFIFMDIQMPVMDGLKAARAIRASEVLNAATVPIIAVSANNYAEDVQNSLAAGMNAHLGKPVDRNLLFMTIARFGGTGLIRSSAKEESRCKNQELPFTD